MKSASMMIAAATVLVLAGCSGGLVSGSPTVQRSGASGSGVTSGSGSSPTAGSSSASTDAPNASFPRSPVTTAIGDPVTADLCAVVPLSNFDGLGYSPGYANGLSPPGCTVEMHRAGQIALRINVFGVGSNGFSHVGPSSLDQSDPTGTRKVDGITIAEYAALPDDSGACPRDVLGQGITLSVYAITVSGAQDRKTNCRAADIMATLMARVAAVGSAPRLQLAKPSVSDLNFCSVLKATKLSDIDGLANLTITPDGAGDNCKATFEPTVELDVQFGITNTQHPSGVAPTTVGGHTLYRTSSSSGECGYASAQGRTPGGYERIATTLDDSAGVADDELCMRLATATARFLDVAGLK